MRKLTLSLALTGLILFVVIGAAAQMSISGEVVSVIDGKTLVIAAPTGRITAELQFIEVPGVGQQLSETVKEHLGRLVLGKIVNYHAQTLYGDRTVGRLMIGNADVSMQMLRDGAAWHVPLEISRQEKGEFDSYAYTEGEAKKENRGVWSIAALRPTWKSGVEKATVANVPMYPGGYPEIASRKISVQRGYWSDRDPSLGDVGALGHGFNAAAKSGFISTSFLPVGRREQDIADTSKTAIDITYFYKESSGNKRKGVFVITIISESAKWRFLQLNNLLIFCDDVKSIVGKPKRSAESDGSVVREKLTYQVDRSTIDKIVNGSDVVLSVGNYYLKPAGGLQLLLYSLLQVAA